MKERVHDKKTVIDKRNRISGHVSLATEPKGEEYDVLTMIDHYEDEGRDILKAAGYPLTLWELSNRLQNESSPPRVHDVYKMLMYFSLVRHYIQANDTNGALCCMAYGVQHVLRSRIRPFESNLLRHTEVVQGASRGGNEKKRLSDLRHQIWQDDARAIWKDKPNLSKQHVAKILKQRYTKHFDEFLTKPGTIAKIIIK